MLQAASRRIQCPEYPARSSLSRRLCGLNFEPMISATLQKALVASGFASRYYELCSKHPIRSAASQKFANADVLAALGGVGSVTKLKGPGRVYSITSPELPEELDFSFIIQGAGAILEPCLGLTVNDTRSGTNYAVLAFSANEEMGLSAPSPSYPRPSFLGLAEFAAVVTGAFEIALQVGKEVPRA